MSIRIDWTRIGLSREMDRRGSTCRLGMRWPESERNVDTERLGLDRRFDLKGHGQIRRNDMNRIG